MEIPVIERISGLANRLQNPSLIAGVFHRERIEEISLIYSFWTWGALILAFMATFRFSTIIVRSKFVVFSFRKDKSAISESPLIKPSNEDHDDDDDDTCSSSSSSDDEDEPRSLLENQEPFDEDSRVAGTGDYEEYQEKKRKLKLSIRRSGGNNFSWSDITNGNSVVKSWDGLGLGFGNSSRNLISLWDLTKNEITSSFCGGKCQISAVSMPSPAVIVSEGLENSRNVSLRVWDARVGHQIPEIFAEWQPRWRNVVGIDSGEGNKLCVRDIRNIGSTLEALMESDVNTWWDSDAVIVDGDCELCRFDGSLKNGCESVVSRCRNAVFSYLF